MDRGDAVKIGFSVQPQARLFQVAATQDRQVKLIHTTKAEYPRDSERAAHRRLSSHRLEGEWFTVPIEVAIETIEWACQHPAEPDLSPPVSFKFTPEEMALLDKLSQDHGGRKAAVVAGLIALDGGNAANSQAVAALLRKLADEVDPK